MYRIGQSTDIHQLAKGEGLIFGGIKINCNYSCIAHSDGDILTHAITESLIGALGLGDLGTFFPDDLEENKGRSSIEMLKIVNSIMNEHNYTIVNIDCLLILEVPKLQKYKEEISKNLALALNINSDQVNVKATTSEKLGYIGREEGIMAQAIVLIKKNE